MTTLTAAAPAKQPGDRLASYFENFFRTVVGVATFGASITFSRIVQTPVAPFHDYGFSTDNIQYLLATSWLLFVVTLAFTSFFASALSLWRPAAVKAFGTQNGRDRTKVLWFASAVSAFLFGLTVASFLTLALVVVAYVGPVGWVAVGFIIFFAVMGFGTIIWRSPLQWPRWLVAREQEHQDRHEAQLERDAGAGLNADYRDHPSQGPMREPLRQYRPEGTDRGRDKGRSTSAEYGGTSRRVSRKDDAYEANRYSKASTIISDPYDPGMYGQREMMMYDDGVREGMVTSRYVN